MANFLMGILRQKIYHLLGHTGFIGQRIFLRHPEAFHQRAIKADFFPNLPKGCGPFILTGFHMPLWEAAADIVICRAGAMTISEMALGEKACIFIPSPYVAENHQYKNAKVLSDADAGALIEEKDLCAETLKKQIDEIRFGKGVAENMRKNIKSFAVKNAAESIFKDMQELMNRELMKLIKREDEAK